MKKTRPKFIACLFGALMLLSEAHLIRAFINNNYTEAIFYVFPVMTFLFLTSWWWYR